MDIKICFEMSVFVVEAIRGLCEFHDCNCNGLGGTWWTDNCTYFSSIDRRAWPWLVRVSEMSEDFRLDVLRHR